VAKSNDVSSHLVVCAYHHHQCLGGRLSRYELVSMCLTKVTLLCNSIMHACHTSPNSMFDNFFIISLCRSTLPSTLEVSSVAENQ
jgi:hypothetical protein